MRPAFLFVINFLIGGTKSYFKIKFILTTSLPLQKEELNTVPQLRLYGFDYQFRQHQCLCLTFDRYFLLNAEFNLF